MYKQEQVILTAYRIFHIKVCKPILDVSSRLSHPPLAKGENQLSLIVVDFNTQHKKWV